MCVFLTGLHSAMGVNVRPPLAQRKRPPEFCGVQSVGFPIVSLFCSGPGTKPFERFEFWRGPRGLQFKFSSSASTLPFFVRFSHKSEVYDLFFDRASTSLQA